MEAEARLSVLLIEADPAHAEITFYIQRAPSA
jgi:hypothetical protein